eukprot:TRINITY_DN1807_c0_g1_i1.p1 TRINITY_DN1807_c0_g1~~TRINITY_DN1807_c0_g1_i1.p1  ORF type:complete len:1411 (-),score=307.54 TRINITY_DN1807_c0_g1_i1:75-4178(-)
MENDEESVVEVLPEEIHVNTVTDFNDFLVLPADINIWFDGNSFVGKEYTIYFTIKNCNVQDLRCVLCDPEGAQINTKLTFQPTSDEDTFTFQFTPTKEGEHTIDFFSIQDGSSLGWKSFKAVRKLKSYLIGNVFGRMEWFTGRQSVLCFLIDGNVREDIGVSLKLEDGTVHPSNIEIENQKIYVHFEAKVPGKYLIEVFSSDGVIEGSQIQFLVTDPPSISLIGPNKLECTTPGAMIVFATKIIGINPERLDMIAKDKFGNTGYCEINEEYDSDEQVFYVKFLSTDSANYEVHALADSEPLIGSPIHLFINFHHSTIPNFGKPVCLSPKGKSRLSYQPPKTSHYSPSKTPKNVFVSYQKDFSMATNMTPGMAALSKSTSAILSSLAQNFPVQLDLSLLKDNPPIVGKLYSLKVPMNPDRYPNITAFVTCPKGINLDYSIVKYSDGISLSFTPITVGEYSLVIMSDGKTLTAPLSLLVAPSKNFFSPSVEGTKYKFSVGQKKVFRKIYDTGIRSEKIQLVFFDKLGGIVQDCEYEVIQNENGIIELHIRLSKKGIYFIDVKVDGVSIDRPTEIEVLPFKKKKIKLDKKNSTEALHNQQIDGHKGNDKRASLMPFSRKNKIHLDETHNKKKSLQTDEDIENKKNKVQVELESRKKDFKVSRHLSIRKSLQFLNNKDIESSSTEQNVEKKLKVSQNETNVLGSRKSGDNKTIPERNESPVKQISDVIKVNTKSSASNLFKSNRHSINTNFVDTTQHLSNYHILSYVPIDNVLPKIQKENKHRKKKESTGSPSSKMNGKYNSQKSKKKKARKISEAFNVPVSHTVMISVPPPPNFCWNLQDLNLVLNNKVVEKGKIERSPDDTFNISFVVDKTGDYEINVECLGENLFRDNIIITVDKLIDKSKDPNRCGASCIYPLGNLLDLTELESIPHQPSDITVVLDGPEKIQGKMECSQSGEYSVEIAPAKPGFYRGSIFCKDKEILPIALPVETEVIQQVLNPNDIYYGANEFSFSVRPIMNRSGVVLEYFYCDISAEAVSIDHKKKGIVTMLPNKSISIQFEQMKNEEELYKVQVYVWGQPILSYLEVSMKNSNLARRNRKFYRSYKSVKYFTNSFSVFGIQNKKKNGEGVEEKDNLRVEKEKLKIESDKLKSFSSNLAKIVSEGHSKPTSSEFTTLQSVAILINKSSDSIFKLSTIQWATLLSQDPIERGVFFNATIETMIFLVSCVAKNIILFQNRDKVLETLTNLGRTVESFIQMAQENLNLLPPSTQFPPFYGCIQTLKQHITVLLGMLPPVPSSPVSPKSKQASRSTKASSSPSSPQNQTSKQNSQNPSPLRLVDGNRKGRTSSQTAKVTRRNKYSTSPTKHNATKHHY